MILHQNVNTIWHRLIIIPKLCFIVFAGHIFMTENCMHKKVVKCGNKPRVIWNYWLNLWGILSFIWNFRFFSTSVNLVCKLSFFWKRFPQNVLLSAKPCILRLLKWIFFSFWIRLNNSYVVCYSVSIGFGLQTLIPL